MISQENSTGRPLADAKWLEITIVQNYLKELLLLRN